MRKMGRRLQAMLCVLLAMLMPLSGVAEGLAEPPAVEQTAEPIAEKTAQEETTPAPTAKPTETPVETEKPVETEAPVETEKPVEGAAGTAEPTEAPAGNGAAKAPVNSDAPAAGEMPNQPEKLEEEAADGWNEDESGRYYILSGERLSDCVEKIEGVLYGFNADGYLACDAQLVVGGVNYVTDKDGVATRVDPKPESEPEAEEPPQEEASNTLEDGWHMIEGSGSSTKDGAWSYIKDGAYVKNQVLKIDGAWYGFDADGRMYDDTSFGEYRAEAGGKLLCNEWYRTSDGDYYYYGDDCKMLRGTSKSIGGALYSFDEAGLMAEKECVVIDGATYYAKSGGACVRMPDGWSRLDGVWYYVKDGAYIKDAMVPIGSSYYIFDAEGRMYDNTAVGEYRAAAGGALYRNSWYCAPNGDYYYYGDDFKMVCGTSRTINGALYLFDETGLMAANRNVEIDGVMYYADKSGACKTVNIWDLIDGIWYYIKDGQYVKDELVRIDGTYYYFDAEGKMCTDTVIGEYRAAADGTIYRNLWYCAPNGDYYYYGNDCKMLRSTSETINRALYIFDETGLMAADEFVEYGGVLYHANGSGACVRVTDGWFKTDGVWYYIKDGKCVRDEMLPINGSYYIFDADGRMYENTMVGEYRVAAGGAVYRNQWYCAPNGDYYYYGDDFKMVCGTSRTINGALYLFDETGLMAANRNVEIDGVMYYADKSGACKTVNTWDLIDGIWYYIKDGQYVKDELVRIGGAYYYFDAEGKMCTDTVIGEYRAAADGTIYRNLWYRASNGDYYYYGNDCKMLRSTATKINRVLYCFDETGRMAENEGIEINGAAYYAKSGGAAKLIPNGWFRFEGIWYYVENGKYVRDRMAEINGSYYLFDAKGRMYENTVVGEYRVAAGGVVYRNEWYRASNGDYYYYGSDCKMLRGTSETINGALYSFDETGLMAANEYVEIDGVVYHADGSGACTVASNDWVERDGKRSYVLNGAYLSDCVWKIDGTLYGFGADGYLACNAELMFDGVRYTTDANGVATVVEEKPEDGWLQKGEDFYYVLNGEYVKDRVIQIEGKWYGFNALGVRYTAAAFECSEAFYRATATGELIVSSWYEESNGNRYYYGSDCKMLRGTSATLNGALYIFDETGRMAADEYVELDGAVYHADQNGACTAVADGWLERDGKRSYILAGAYLRSCVYTIEDVLYGFDADGYLACNAEFKIGDVWYATDENGVATVLPDRPEDGWVQKDEDFYYVLDGEYVKDRVIQIEGKWYGFNALGVRYTATAFECADAESGAKAFYRAAASGELLVNLWYEATDGKWYYYGAAGKAAQGYQQVNGTYYYFGADGLMFTDQIYTDENGVSYVIDSEGVAVALSGADGWRTLGKKWFYVRDGKPVRSEVISISGTWYGFDENGLMYDNVEFSLPGATADTRYWYRAKAGGSLYANERYIGGDGVKRYYGQYARAVTGVYKISKTIYYFDENGILVEDFSGGVVWEGQNYVFVNGSGQNVGTAEGWKSIDGYWYYISNGVLVMDRILPIGNDYYMFAANGRMYSSTEIGDYRAKEDGVLYRNEWYCAQNGDYYYYGADSRMIRGTTATINGAFYSFDAAGVMARGKYFTLNGALYLADKDGHCQRLADGWTEHPLDGSYRYILNGSFVGGGYRVIDGEGYYFTGNPGVLMEDRVFWATINEVSGYRIAQDGGALLTKPGWTDFQGGSYYVNADGTLYVGLLEWNGAKYYLKPEMMKVGEYVAEFVTGEYNSKTDISKVYTINDKGALVEATQDGFYRVWCEATESFAVCYILDGELVKNALLQMGEEIYCFDSDGWRSSGLWEIDGDLYYFDNDGCMKSNAFITLSDGEFEAVVYATESGALAIGETKINDKWYYFNEDGAMQFGLVTYNGQTHIYGDDGVWQGQLSKAGWNTVGGKDYYMLNGSALKNCTATIDAKVYVFDAAGVKLRNGKVAFDGAYYLLASSGEALVGWQEADGIWYYGAADTGKLYADGEFTINGQRYRFDEMGEMVIGSYAEDGKLYVYDANGIKTGESALKDGWAYVGGKAFYYEGGKPYTGWLENTYYVKDGAVLMGEEYWPEKTVGYYFGFDGKLAKSQWLYYGWAYATEDGTLACDEWVTIDGDTYYFDDVEKVTYPCWIDGVYHYFDEEGRYLGTEGAVNGALKAPAGVSGWTTVDGVTYYARDGYYLSDTVTCINGAWYAFAVNGAMRADEFLWVNSTDISSPYSGYRYFDSDGRMIVSAGWKQMGGYWYYFDGDGEMVHGWQSINGARYYFAWYYGGSCECARMVTGPQIINGVPYLFTSSGALDETWTVPAKDGWLKTGTARYYFRNGKLLREGVYTIAGVTYGFGADGRLLCDTVYSYDDGNASLYYTDSEGRVVTTVGWKNLGWGWIYIGTGGRLYNSGTYEINGVLYVFDHDGIWAE